MTDDDRHQNHDQDHDYVTLSGIDDHRVIVCIMTYDRVHDEWKQKKMSQMMSRRTAEHLANAWAAALGLEVR